MNIIREAFGLTHAVAAYVKQARRFFYEVMLFDHACPKCQGSLAMIQEGRCRCTSCAHTFDPTIEFQRCLECGGAPKLEIRRYRCSQCGEVISSRFLFDGLVFDAAYFREKMAEHRQRKREQRDRRRTMQAENRSPALDAEPMDLAMVPGLADALDRLTAGIAEHFPWPMRQSFDLSRYEKHIQAHIEAFPVPFDRIPLLSEDARQDRIWRFIAVIFMAHAGLIELEQQGQTILVMQREVD